MRAAGARETHTRKKSATPGRASRMNGVERRRMKRDEERMPGRRRHATGAPGRRVPVVRRAQAFASLMLVGSAVR
jgi:hypothetical protein